MGDGIETVQQQQPETPTGSNHGIADGGLDLETLTKKIAKCDRLLKKKGKSHPDFAKIRKKKASYLQQLGELAFRAAQTSMAVDDEPISPTGVVSQHPLDSSKFQDSLAVFEEFDSSFQQNENEEEPSTVVKDNIPEEDEDVLEDKPLKEAMTEICDPSLSSEPSTQVEDTVENKESQSTSIEEPKNVQADVQEKVELPQHDEASEAASEEDTEPSQEHKFAPSAKSSKEEIEESHENKIEEDEGSIALETEQDELELQPEANSTPSAPEDLRRSESDLSSGNGSVSKLRAMFDSPGKETPRRKWKARKKATSRSEEAPRMVPLVDTKKTESPVVKNHKETPPPPPPALSPTDETSSDVSSTSPTRFESPKVESPTKLSHPLSPHLIPASPSGESIEQAPATKSVHDIEGSLIALVSLFPESLYDHLPKQSRSMTIFKGNNIGLVYVDGSNPLEKGRRDELFALSGRRGVYPQFFVKSQSTGKLEFFADFDTIEYLNDCQTLREAIEKASCS